MPRSPWRRIRLASIAAGLMARSIRLDQLRHRQLDISHGCQDHTVLPYASAPYVLRADFVRRGSAATSRSAPRGTESTRGRTAPCGSSNAATRHIGLHAPPTWRRRSNRSHERMTFDHGGLSRQARFAATPKRSLLVVRQVSTATPSLDPGARRVALCRTRAEGRATQSSRLADASRECPLTSLAVCVRATAPCAKTA